MTLMRELATLHRRLGRPVDVEADRGPQNEMDAAVAGEQRELSLRERGRLEARARALVAAIQRVDAGTYGRCGACGEPIAPSRLQAIPDAASCRACQTVVEEETDGAGPGRVIRVRIAGLDDEDE